MGNDHFGKFEASSAGFKIFQNGSKLHVWSFFMYIKRLRFATDVFKNFFKKWAPLMQVGKGETSESKSSRQ